MSLQEVFDNEQLSAMTAAIDWIVEAEAKIGVRRRDAAHAVLHVDRNSPQLIRGAGPCLRGGMRAWRWN